MSMISAQIDELRRMADGQATYRDARAVMLQAADTIWELRDDLQRANDAVRDAEHDESRAWDRVRKVEAENTKLRELGGEVASILFNLDVDRCGLCQRDSISHPCPVYTVKGGECLIKSELRELGVEVTK